MTNQIFFNKVLNISILSWFIAQLLKVIVVYVRNKKIDFRRLVGSGGMPSSHSAFVVSLAFCVGKSCGFNSPEFAISTVFALIVMYDAAGVRRAAGRQAKILNTIIQDMHDNGKFPEEKLKELIGHTPVEVIAGAIVGAITAIAL
jgi:uncharacterized protein